MKSQKINGKLVLIPESEKDLSTAAVAYEKGIPPASKKGECWDPEDLG